LEAADLNAGSLAAAAVGLLHDQDVPSLQTGMDRGAESADACADDHDAADG